MLVKHIAIFLLVIIAGYAGAQDRSPVALPVIFSDNMVLQQQIPVSIWGKATAGESVQVDFAGKKATTKAAEDGKWMIRLPALKAGGPHRMKILAGNQVIEYKNVMVGEVWVCSGQSNMEMPLAGWGKINDYEKEIAAANYPDIRLLQAQHVNSVVPLDEVKLDGGQWQVCSPQTIAGFSSVAYFFARNIYQNRHVPIGLIHTSWGGTVAEAWTSGTSLKQMPDFAAAVQSMEQSGTEEEHLKDYEQRVAAWERLVNEKDSAFKDNRATWTSSAYNASSWSSMQLPANWEKAGLPDFDGIVWFRKTILLPEDWSGQDLQLSTGPVDDDDICYFNGTEIGRTEGWDKPRKYNIPGKLVKAGENTIVMRVLDGSGGGGIYGSPDDMFLQYPSGKKISLAGKWQYRQTLNISDVPARPDLPEGPNRPTVLYNAMIHPFIQYGIRGAIWYQGESNASRAPQYRELFPLLIKDWRKQWNQGDFPFYFVQLANFMEPKAQPGESDWAELREAQLKTLSVPNTGMAVAIDIGDSVDIHPKNKQDVGLRLALIARAKTYGEKIPFSGPVYQAFKKEGTAIRLSFAHTNGGLQASGSGALRGFAIAGADKKFHWATAKIIGNSVLVSSEEVRDPVAVRYGWADNPDCNLYNKAGLPASPFRTDDW